MSTKPLNNNVLIEVLKEDSVVSRADDNESLKRGRVVEAAFSQYHITASSFGLIDTNLLPIWHILQGKDVIVRWEEFAEGGQTFEEDGKTYALVPWWRLISYEAEDDVKA